MAARRARDEAGSTLVELLVTLVILGIAFVTLLGGMFTAVTTSDRHRKQTVADSALRSFAEAVKAAAYQDPCSTTAYEASYAPPSSFTRSVTCGSLAAPAPPVQLLTLEVASLDGRATETVQVVKRR